MKRAPGTNCFHSSGRGRSITCTPNEAHRTEAQNHKTSFFIYLYFLYVVSELQELIKTEQGRGTPFQEQRPNVPQLVVPPQEVQWQK